MYSIVPYLTNLQVLVYTCTEVVRVLHVLVSTVLSYVLYFLVLQYYSITTATATATATAAAVIADYRSVTVLR